MYVSSTHMYLLRYIVYLVGDLGVCTGYLQPCDGARRRQRAIAPFLRTHEALEGARRGRDECIWAGAGQSEMRFVSSQKKMSGPTDAWRSFSRR